MKRGVVAAALVLGLPVCGRAADPRPVTQPTRDVDVVYEVPRGDQQIEERSRFQGGTGLQRLDSPTSAGSYMLANPGAGIISMVSASQRKVIAVPRPAGPLNGAPATFRKLGDMTVAGLACTEWLVTPQQVANAVPNQICLTADGVMLNLRVGDQQRARAATVTYAPIDAAVFTVPAEYTHLTGKPTPP